MALQPGAMLTPTLRLDRELGHGAMGEVWIATNLALGSQVAVKVLRDSGMSGGESQARFQQEARGLAQLDSPHVVRIYDFGVTADDEPFIVMELLKGRDLRSHIEAVGALPLAATESIVVQVCRALSAAHARRIVHRDIKPANIFLTDAAGSVFVKVLDFGVAKFLGADLGMTTTGAIVGTPYYASPEQLLAPKDLDHRTDLWSVAVVAYACLTGKLPFVADTLAALSIKIHQGEFEAPSKLRPELPPAVDAWMARALSQKPADRYASAQELADALSEALAAPTEAPKPEEPEEQELVFGTVVMAEAPAELRQTAAPRPAAGAPAPTHDPTVAMPQVPSAGPRTGPLPVMAAPNPTPPPAAPAAMAMAQSTLSPTSAGGLAAAPARAERRNPAVVLAAVAITAVLGVGLAVAFLMGGDEPSETGASAVEAPPSVEVDETATPPDAPTAEVTAQPSAKPEATTAPTTEPTAEVAAPPATSSTTPAPPPVVVPRPKAAPPPPPPSPKDDNPFGTRR